ncbi:hypothetical protein [Candidatus Hodarchaeum mangrovi]
MSQSSESQSSDFLPLNLPRGSVRAALTLSIAFTTVYLAVFFPNSLPESLRNVFIVSVAFYYSSRASTPLITVVSTPSSSVSKEKPPLYLPTATVRLTLAIATVIAIVITLVDKNEVPSFMVTVLITIIGFSLGIIVRETAFIISSWYKPKKPSKYNFREIFAHFQAAVILLLVMGICLIDLLQAIILSLDWFVIRIINSLLELVIGYYFGSRISRVV